MVNIWDYVDYNGKIKIVTVDRQEIVGKIYYVEDKDEGDSQDDCDGTDSGERHGGTKVVEECCQTALTK